MWYIRRSQLLKFRDDSKRELNDLTETLIKNRYQIVRAGTSNHLALMLADCQFDGEVDVWDKSEIGKCTYCSN